MEWFSVWWNSLGLIGQIMACAAIPMTVVMFLQLILMIIGVGFGSETDGDVDDGGIDTTAETTPPDSRGSGAASTFKIFTIRGIVAFFALGGWAGLAALATGLHPFWAIQISLFAGVCALMLASIVIRLALRMQTSGNLNINNAVALTGDVYIRIPAERSEKGKVTMLLQERFVELDAITDSDTDILPETKVEVISIADGDTLVVRPVEQTE
jgi:membrane protein implicated in regulation of membrane protease activity